MVAAACTITCWPTWVEPVKLTMSIRGSVPSRMAPSAPASTITLKTPAGRFAACAASPNTRLESGASGLGRSTTLFPAINAEMVFHMLMTNGKL